MEVPGSNMLFILVGAIVIAASGRAGYIYPRPSIPFVLPKIGQSFESSLLQEAQENNIHETDESVVSYSIPANNYYDLNHQNQLQLEILNLPENVQNIQIPITQQNNFDVNTAHHTLQENIEKSSDIPSAHSVHNIVPPKITKHIYFHVPPPDIEDTPNLLPVLPNKKVYKIIFIKLPSQETRNIAEVQRISLNRVAPIEDRTIIYVLSKKPETPEVILPKPVPSEHEVLFVKYRGSPEEAVAQINDELVQSDPVLFPTLQPGLINGKR